MSSSTGIVVSAGALTLTDLALTGWDPSRGVRVAAGTVLAAFVSAGLDHVVPGLGTAGAVLLLVAAVAVSAPTIAGRLKLGGGTVRIGGSGSSRVSHPIGK